MKHYQQPRRSSVCGQTCVAMVAGITPEAAVDVCSNGRRRSSSEHDLRRGLKVFGLVLSKFNPWLSSVDMARTAARTVPHVTSLRVLARVRFEWRRHGYHWIAIAGGYVHDPSFDESCTVATYARYLRRRRGYITSWAYVVPAREKAA